MKSLSIRLLLINILIIVGIMLASIASAQTAYTDTNVRNYYNDIRSVKALFTIYLDDKIVESDEYKIHVYNGYDVDITYVMPEKFMLLLKYNELYTIGITHKGYPIKTISIDTRHAVNKNWLLDLNSYLYSDEPNKDCGVLKYDPYVDRFKLYTYE